MHTSTRLWQLHDAGVSIWLDTLSRDLLDSGGFGRLIADARSPARRRTRPSSRRRSPAPSATTSSSPPRPARVRDPRELFFELALHDVGGAADRLRAVYDAERRARRVRLLRMHARPRRRHRRTIEQALDLWGRLARPNVMIKVPATAAGDPGDRGAHRAWRQRQRHAAVLRRPLRAGHRRLHRGPRTTPRGRPAGGRDRVRRLVLRLARRRQGRRVAARRLATCAAGWPSPTRAAPTAATAGASPTSAGRGLRDAGATPQRPLWASTGTKDPAYSDVLYVEELIAPDVINTMPRRRWGRSPTTARSAMHHRGRTPRGAERSCARPGSGHRSLRDHRAARARRRASFCDSYRELLARVDSSSRPRRRILRWMTSFLENFNVAVLRSTAPRSGAIAA